MQESKGKLGYSRGTISQTTSRDITLMWNDRKNKLTVPLTKESNVGTFHLAPGYSKYDEFCCMLAEDEQDRELDPIISTEPVNKDKEFPIVNDEKWNKTKERESSLQGDQDRKSVV